MYNLNINRFPQFNLYNYGLSPKKPRTEFYADLVAWDPLVYACPHDKHRLWSLSFTDLGSLYPNVNSCECGLRYNYYYQRYRTIPFHFWTSARMSDTTDAPWLYTASKEIPLFFASLLVGTAATFLGGPILGLIGFSFAYFNPNNRLQKKVNWDLINEAYVRDHGQLLPPTSVTPSIRF